ncbi:hypothetical protein Bpfe_030352 [Biomphalaria pfeifferi]|uniref:Uncharacterized protein n=1 Tax=Biomphalaria pfeifferi TaxID=112525 RepID=A0AAD8ARF9_BIOPF|nr:hypothetical protein Bpfe_030352 [Biomphalaria pfeifferi]
MLDLMRAIFGGAPYNAVLSAPHVAVSRYRLINMDSERTEPRLTIQLCRTLLRPGTHYRGSDSSQNNTVVNKGRVTESSQYP